MYELCSLHRCLYPGILPSGEKNTKCSLFMKLQELARAATLAILLWILKYKVGGL